MSCPHSSNPEASPASCSQCLGVTVRRVQQAPDPSRLVVDGLPVERLFMPPVNPLSVSRNTGNTLGRADRRCGICGRLDHTRVNCTGTDEEVES